MDNKKEKSKESFLKITDNGSLYHIPPKQSDIKEMLEKENKKKNKKQSENQ